MKYTDPNTGKTYSSNRGWKIFAGIVTVLLVALIAFVAVYAVNHDLFDETVESSEDIEIIEKDDTVVVIYATECEDGTMRYDWRYVSGTCEVCYPPQEHGFTTGDCEGHTTYVDAYGFVSDYHPYRVSVTLSGKTASDTLDADIVFSSMPAKDDLYFNAKPVAVEANSTAGIESVRILQNFRYETEKADADTTTRVMYDSIMDEVLAGGRSVFSICKASEYIDGEWYDFYRTMEEWGFYYSGNVLREVSDDTAYILGNKETSSDEAASVTRYGISSMTAYAGDAYEEHTYSSPSDATVRDGYYTLSVTMSNGSVYAYDFYVDTDELQGSNCGFGYIESPLLEAINHVWQDYGTGFENMYVYSKLNVVSERGDDPVTCDEYTGWVETEDVTAAGVSYTVADGINCQCIYLENNAVWKGLNSTAGLSGWGGYTDMYRDVGKYVPNYYTTSHGVTYAYPAYRYDFYTYIVTEDFAGNIQVIDATMYGDITNFIGDGSVEEYYGTADLVWNPTYSTVGGVTYYDAKELIEAKEAVAIEDRGGSVERYYKDVAYAYVNDWIVNGMNEYTVIDLPDKDYWCALVTGS